MNYLNHTIEAMLAARGAKLIRFVDISCLSEKQNRQFPNAIVFALPLTTMYIKEVVATPDYVAARIADNYNFDDDEYSLIEIKAGTIADEITGSLVEKGYQALSQSDTSLLDEGSFDVETHTSILPNKTIALLGGLGWIGKNNLLITPEYGSAQCLGTVLTNAPLDTIRHELLASGCSHCNVCVDICEKKVLKGRLWSQSTPRDEIVDVYGCSTCLKCLVHCPQTKKYVNSNYEY